MSSAETVRPAAARSPRSSAPASTGTTTAASAPPTTTSNMTFGRRFAVLYTSARQPPSTVLENTTHRPNPVTRATIVTAATSSAAPAIPAVRLGALTAGPPDVRLPGARSRMS